MVLVEGGKDKNTHNALDKNSGGIIEGEEQETVEKESALSCLQYPPSFRDDRKYNYKL